MLERESLEQALRAGPRSKHFADLQDLQPSDDELLVGAQWAITHDTSEVFRGELIRALAALELEVTDADL